MGGYGVLSPVSGLGETAVGGLTGALGGVGGDPAAGLNAPLVGANVGGIKYTVRDGETGFLIPPRDPDALADRLARLLSDKTLVAAFGANGLARVRRSFTWRHIATGLSDVYDDVLAERRVELATAIAATSAAPAASPSAARRPARERAGTIR